MQRILTLLIALACASLTPAASHALDVFPVSDIALVSRWPVELAKQEGFFQKRGLDVQISNQNPNNLAGALDANSRNPAEGVRAMNSNEPLSWIGKQICMTPLVMTHKSYPLVLATQKGLSLEGGMSYAASSDTSFIANTLLRALGRSPGETVADLLQKWSLSTAPRMRSPERFPALLTGQIQAAPLVPPESYYAELSNTLTVYQFRDLLELMGARSMPALRALGYAPRSPYWAMCKQVEDNPDIYKRFVDSVREAAAFAADPKNEQSVRNMIAKALENDKYLDNLARDRAGENPPRLLDAVREKGRIIDKLYAFVRSNALPSGVPEEGVMAASLEIQASTVEELQRIRAAYEALEKRPGPSKPFGLVQ